MDLPSGHPLENNKGMVCKLNKAIYGFKQSPRAWYGKLSSALIRFGFKRSATNSSMFTKAVGEGIVVILIYEDDLIITSSNLTGITELKPLLSKEFDIKDLGKLRYFLGIEVASSDKGLFLTQRKYTLDLLRRLVSWALNLLAHLWITKVRPCPRKHHYTILGTFNIW